MNEIVKRIPKPKPPRPVESFGGEILAALLKGATDGFKVQTDYSTAIRFRLRVHQLREAMRKSGHDKYSLVARVRVTIEPVDPNEPVDLQGRHKVPKNRSAKYWLQLRPNDTEFGDILKNAGVDIELGSEESPSIEPSPTPATADSLEDLLRDLKG